MNNNKENTERPKQPVQNRELDELESLFYKVLSNWHWIVLTVAVFVVLAFFKTRYTAPLYNISTTVLDVKYERESATGLSVRPGLEYFKSTKDISHELTLLRSNSIVSETIRRLNWKVFYSKVGQILTTELYPESPVTIRYDTLSEKIPYNAEIKCKVLDPDTYTLETENRYWEEFFEDRIYNFGKSYNNSGFAFTISIDPAFNFETDDKIFLIKINDFKSLVNSYRSKLQIKWEEEGSAVIRISVVSEMPRKEIDFLNKYLQVIDEKSIYEKNTIATKTIFFINEQLNYLFDSIQSIGKDIETMKLGNEELPIGSSYKFQRINQLEEEKSALLLANEYCDYLDEYIKTHKNGELIPPNNFGIQSTSLNQLITTYIDLKYKNRVASLLTIEKNPILERQIDFRNEQIADLEKAMIEELGLVRVANNLKITKIDKEVNNFLGDLNRLLSQERDYQTSQKNQYINEEIYTILLKKRYEASIAKASAESDYKLVDEPMIVGGLLQPQPKKNYMVAIMLGFFIAVLFIYIRTVINNKVVTKEELQKISSIPLLGVIGHSHMKQGIVSRKKPKSLITESFRSIRANLQFFKKKKTSETILITSSVSGEGKTFCSINLAYVLAIAKKRTVILAADMRRPSLQKYYNISRSASGLSTFLSGKSGMEEIIVQAEDNLYIIPAGPVPPNPAELLLDEEMKTLIGHLKTKFDYIIIDTPPLAVVSDTHELLKYSDHNLLIVRQKYTPRAALRTISEMYDDGLLGNISILFNDVDFSKLSYRSGKRYGYGYGYAYGYTNGGYYEDDKAGDVWWKRWITRGGEKA